MEFEKVFPELTGFGRYQKLIFFFVLLPVQLSYYCHIYSHFFLTYQPPHWCKIDHLLPKSNESAIFSANQTNGGTSAMALIESFKSNEILQRYFFTPSRYMIVTALSDDQNNTSQVYFGVNHSIIEYIDSLSSCSRYNASIDRLISFHHRLLQQLPSPILSNQTTVERRTSSQVALNRSQSLITNPPIIDCNEWTFNQSWLGTEESIVTKWNLVCHHEWLQLVALSALLFGLFLSFPLYYVLSHSLGFRRTYFLMLLLQCGAGALSAFVVDFKHFCLLRFVIGLSLAAIVIVPTDFMVETCGVRVMAQIVAYNESIRLAGSLLLVLVAYFVHDYRHLSIAISLPFVVFLFLWWSFPESPNHLLVTGQIGRLEKFILDIAHTNLAFVDPEFDDSIKRRIYIELAIYRDFMITSLMRHSFGHLEPYINYIDFSSAGVDEAALMLRDMAPFSADFRKQSLNKSSESSLVNKLAQHLEDKNETVQKSPKAVANGQIHTPPEIWSEANSDTEPTTPNGSIKTENRHLNNRKTVQSLSSNSPASSTPHSVAAIPNIPSASTNSYKERTTLSSICRLPNMRRKFLVLLFLSITHIFLYMSFPYFILDFIGKSQGSDQANNPYTLFTLVTILNFVGIGIAQICLRYKFGRKCTFLLANLMASVFTLGTGLSMHSPMTTINKNESLSPFDAWRHQLNVPIVFYSIAKVFQATTYLILLVWLYEILPPIADCSLALHTCLSLAHFPILLTPLLLHGMKKSLKLSITIPDVLLEILRRTSLNNQMSIPVHYLIFGVLLFLSGLLCLMLPETGSIEPLPCTLNEAEIFTPFVSSSNSSANNQPRWYSLKVLFSFQPPNIRPLSGILKKSQVNSQRAVNGKLRNRKQRQIHLDSILEEKFARISKDCANKTAINSLYNQFLSGGNATAYELAAYERMGINGHNQSAWMSAVTDAAASGMPLFVPVNESASQGDTSKYTLGQTVNVASVAFDAEHQTLKAQLQQHPFAPTTFKSQSLSRTLPAYRRHSIHESALSPIENNNNYYQQHHYPHPQDAKESYKTGSNAELTYMATVMDLPYSQQTRFQSLPRVHPLPPMDVWDDLRSTDEQLLHWLHHQTPSWSQTAHSTAKVRVMDIIDTNRGISGQMDAYIEPERGGGGGGYFSRPFEAALTADAARHSSMALPHPTQPTTTATGTSNLQPSHQFSLDDDANFTESHDLSNDFDVDTTGAFALALDV